MSFIGGKKHSVKHVKKASRRKTRNNKVLKSWIGFVKKVQKDENIKSYKNAMMRAKARKSEWNKAMKGGVGTPVDEKIDYDQGSSSLDDKIDYDQGSSSLDDKIDYDQGSSSLEDSTLLPSPAPSKRGVPRYDAIVEEDSILLPSPAPSKRGVPRYDAIVEEDDQEKRIGGRKTKRANRRRSSRKHRASRRR
jgi:hypothetical protein